MKTIFNTKNVDPMSQPLFLGKDLGVQRYDVVKYPAFKRLDSMQMMNFWRPEEIELKKDRGDFKEMSDNEKFIFTSNLKYQTMLDSVICRGVPTLLEYVTNTELEACMMTWQFFEKIHSQSYSYIIQNVYADSSEVFEGIYEDKEIMKRANGAIEDYNNLMGMASESTKPSDLKKQIYMTIVSINILEAVRFYVSFICSFAFAENKKMAGNADIIKLIKRDEALHLANTQEILKILHKEEKEGFTKVAKQCQEDAVKMFERAAQEEKEWASYLFKDGSIIGLNEIVLHQYIDWLCMSRRKAIGLPYENVGKNPIGGWTGPWMSSESVQVAPQEHEITSYKIGASKNDMEDMDFSGIL
jgi:ribonucleotide reductase beta subunit family protein with ferritin-like domain|tara:strand:+ start:4109 stop:5179 length:1071 start_codon:yes stop_codon:yes gene_type:complete